ncbi:MAG: serine hydrolase [Clostridia bacterium]|nr:serine hydrolase [Clostridia bacterium]
MDFSLMKTFLDRLTAWRIPGNSISVCVENKEVFSYQSGYENVEEKKKMPKDILFNIYSCSKPVTVTAALQLYERGYFLLDDPLYDFIPAYKHMYIKDANGNAEEVQKTITLRHLFTMTSGIQYDKKAPSFEKARKLTDGKMNTLTVAECMAENELSFVPGEKWEYGYSHDVLAAVVEVVSGKRFREYVKENIFTPLEMNESYYHNEAVIDRVAELYRYDNTGERDIVNLQASSDNTKTGRLVKEEKGTPAFGIEYDSGSAGITASVSDLSKFASALANGGVGRNGERILSAGTIELLRTNQLEGKLFEDFRLRWPQHKGYSYGLGVKTMIDRAKSGSPGSLGEFGWGGAAGATLLADPDLKLSMFYTHHMLNPHEAYYQPRLRNVLYSCVKR